MTNDSNGPVDGNLNDNVVLEEDGHNAAGSHE